MAKLKAGDRMLVVLQSDPQKLAAELGREDALPFDIICDPERKLYHQFSIDTAVSKGKMAGLKTVVKMVRAVAAGYKHGRYEGEELQLPAVLVVDGNLKITYVHYGKTVDDVLDVSGLAKLLGEE